MDPQVTYCGYSLYHIAARHIPAYGPETEKSKMFNRVKRLSPPNELKVNYHDQNIALG